MSDSVDRAPRVLLADCSCCDRPFAETDLRDRLSCREASISGLCQICQDVTWIGFSDGTDGMPSEQYLVRRGVVFAHSSQRAESALIPFVFGAPGRHPGWDLFSMFRIGGPSDEVDPEAALSSSRSYALSHRLSVATVDTPANSCRT